MKVSHNAVREVLATVGPLTSREVAAFFPGSPHWDVSGVLSSLKGAARKQVYVCEWVRDNGHGKTVWRRVYALGDQPDAPQPKRMSNREAVRRYREKNKIPKANSVWTWGAQL